MNDNLTGFEALLPVKTDAPEDTAETIENMLENCNDGIKMIIIDESQAKCFWVGSHYTNCQGYAQEPSPDLFEIDEWIIKICWKYLPDKIILSLELAKE